jgi:hypothetical protein
MAILLENRRGERPIDPSDGIARPGFASVRRFTKRNLAFSLWTPRAEARTLVHATLACGLLRRCQNPRPAPAGRPAQGDDR